MFIYKYIIVSFLIIWLIFKLLKKDYDLFSITIFLAPFSSIYMNIGLNLSIFQITQVLLLLYATISIVLHKKKNVLNFKNVYIVGLIFYVIVSTLVMSVYVIDDFKNFGSWFRSDGRFVSQIILFLITYSLVSISFNYIKSIKDVYKYLKVILDGMIILAILGWIQLIIYLGIGIDIFPLGLRDGIAYSGIEQELGFFRMSSLSHEPKGLSVFMVIAFFTLQVLNYYKISVYKYDLLIKILFVATLFLTLATSGIILFFILGFVYFIYNILKNKQTISLKQIIINSTIFGIILIMILSYQNEVYEIFKLRVLDRDIISEDFDAPIQLFLLDSPQYLFFGSGLGNIHNLANSYIPIEYMHYMNKIIFVAKSGYLRLVSEIGLIGLVIFLMIFYIIYKKLNYLIEHVEEEDRKIISSIQFILILVLIAYLARTYVVNELIVFLAIANILAFSKQIQYKVNV